jgi:hypothetical protein
MVVKDSILSGYFANQNYYFGTDTYGVGDFSVLNEK